MTAFQIAVLFLLGLLVVGVMGFVAYLIFGNSTTGTGLPSLDIFDPSRAIIGKWEGYVEPTPTPTPGPTQTPVVMQDIFGNSYVVTPAQSVVINTGCTFGYPHNIEFFTDGTYTGTAMALESEIFVWQGGQYKILDDGRIKMQIKNGLAVYNFNIDGDKLTFTDDAKCEIRYQRAPTTTFTTTNTAITTNTSIATNIPSITYTAIIPPPTWASSPAIQPSPSRTKAPTWTLLPEMITPTITSTFTIIPNPPSWTPTQTIQPSPTRTKAPTWTLRP